MAAGYAVVSRGTTAVVDCSQGTTVACLAAWGSRAEATECRDAELDSSERERETVTEKVEKYRPARSGPSHAVH